MHHVRSRPTPPVRAMADAIVHRIVTAAGCTAADLKAAGFSDAEIARHGEAAFAASGLALRDLCR